MGLKHQKGADIAGGMLGDVGGCWGMLGMLGDVGGCWGMLGDVGGCWGVGAGNHLRIP